MLTHYVSEYFEKEAFHVRILFVEHTRIAVQDSNLLTRPPGFDSSIYTSTAHSISFDRCYGKTPQEQVQMMPALRADRIKSIQQVINTVANRVFMNRMFSITTDAVTRMESIGRDDRHLTTRIKDLYLFQLGFLSDCILLPMAKACTALLLRWRTNAARANSSVDEQLPNDAIGALSAFTFGVHRLRSHFDEVYARPLSAVPNTIAICKENRQRVFQTLELNARELLHAWSLCVVVSIEKILATLQSKFDYAPKFEASNRAAIASAQSIFSRSGTNNYSGTAASSVEIADARQQTGGIADSSGQPHSQLKASNACEAVCKVFLSAVNAVRGQESSLYGLNIGKLFWVPIGVQLVAALISHIRKQKVSPLGAKSLARDIRDYSRVRGIYRMSGCTIGYSRDRLFGQWDRVICCPPLYSK